MAVSAQAQSVSGQTVEAYVGELSKISELATSATKDSFAPFKGRVQAWLEAVQSVRAA